MNTLVTIIFIAIAALILGAAIMVVTVRNIIHAALWLISSFFGVGALYLLLEAEFIAVSQILIYVGATSILILFAIMLTRHVTGEGERQLFQRWWAALLAAGGLFGLLLVPVVFTQDWQISQAPAGQAQGISAARELGTSFMSEYLLPFTLVSVLLLVALVGAIVIAFEERAQRRRVLTLAEEVALKKQQATAKTPTSGGEPASGVPALTVQSETAEG